VPEVLEKFVVGSSPLGRRPLKGVASTNIPGPKVEVGIDTDHPVGARLQLFKRMWTRDAWSHKTVSKSLSWSWLGKPPRFRTFFQKSDPAIRSFLKEMLKATRFIAFQGRLFSLPKKESEKERVILDISSLNKWISCPRFKMTSVSQVCRVLPQGS